MGFHEYIAGARHFFTLLTLLVPLSIYISLCLASFLQKKDSKATKPRLRTFQLITTAIIICISIAQTVFLGTSVELSDPPNTDLLYGLYQVLLWVVFFLGILDQAGDADSPHLLAWTSFAFLELIGFLITTTSFRNLEQKRAPVVVGLLGVRLIVTVALIGISSIARPCCFRKSDAVDESETQALLDAETVDHMNGSANSATKSIRGDDLGEHGNKDDNSEDDDNEEDTDDETDEDEKAELETLKKRPLREYLLSFTIFIPLLKPQGVQQWAYIATEVACTLAERAINVLQPLALGAFINSLTRTDRLPWKPLSAFIGLYVLNTAGVVSTVQNLANVRYISTLKMKLDNHCYKHVMQLSADFHDSKNSQRLGRVVQTGDSIIFFFEEIMFSLLPRISDLVISLGILTWLFGAYLSFVVATTIILFTWANTKFVKQITKIRRIYNNAFFAMWDQMWETHFAWMTVSHFNRVGHEETQTYNKSAKVLKTDMRQEQFNSIARFARQAIIAAGFIATIILATYQIVYGDTSRGLGVGSIVMLNSYWEQVMSPVSGIIRVVNRAAERIVDAEKLLLILEKKPTVKDKENPSELDFRGGTVDFENVSFSYDNARIVSKNITFHAKPGETIAIVGETGGGKSTLLKLLFRFYDPTEGRILIDGQDIRDLRLESFREIFGYVPQDPTLFTRTVMENVRYADLHATDADVLEACKAAVLHDKIMAFPKKYAQKVGERGTKLSGGEGQRLAIARAILKKPKMLLLDEATSSVDSVTETKIHNALQQLCKGRTTFIVAHRLSTILHADQILVIKDGQLVEAGPHRELIKRDGAYKELWDAQLKLQAAKLDPDEDDDNDDNE